MGRRNEWYSTASTMATHHYLFDTMTMIHVPIIHSMWIGAVLIKKIYQKLKFEVGVSQILACWVIVIQHTFEKRHSPYIFSSYFKKTFSIFFYQENLSILTIMAVFLQYHDPIPPTKLLTYSPTSYLTVLLDVFPLKIHSLFNIFDVSPLAKPQVFPRIAFCWARMTLWCHAWGSKPP